MFKKLTRNACQRNRARDLSPFLNSGQILAGDHSLGISPVSIDCWKRWAISDLIQSSVPLGSSSPKALDGLRPLRSLDTPSFVNNIMHEWCRSIQERGLFVLTFKLTIKFFSNSD